MTTTTTLPGRPVMSKGRLEALTDGIFAIVLTLLVLDLRVPELPRHVANAEIVRALAELGPRFASFVITFLIGGAFWMLHHMCFHRIRHVDRVMIWLTLAFLMFVALLPFSTGMLGRFMRQSASQMLYYGNILGMAVTLEASWVYILQRGLAEDAPADAAPLTFRIAMLATASAVGLAFAAADPDQSYLAFAAAIIAFRLAERIGARRRAGSRAR